MWTNWFQHLSCLDRVFKPHIEYKLSFGWQTTSLLRKFTSKIFKDIHFIFCFPSVFLTFSKLHAHSNMIKLKRRKEQALAEQRIKALVTNCAIVDLAGSLVCDFSFPFIFLIKSVNQSENFLPVMFFPFSLESLIHLTTFLIGCSHLNISFPYFPDFSYLQSVTNQAERNIFFKDHFLHIALLPSILIALLVF